MDNQNSTLKDELSKQEEESKSLERTKLRLDNLLSQEKTQSSNRIIGLQGI